MAEWKWFAGEPKGRCPHCSEPLRHPDVLVEWRTRAYHVGCLIEYLTAFAPPDSKYYSPPGTDWSP